MQLTQLKLQIQAGEYVVDESRVAEALLTRLVGGRDLSRTLFSRPGARSRSAADRPNPRGT
jgi:hypothetical protein